jgi:16S rRNA (guanine(966)-N(2))-methyltransferase RsmD
MPEKNLNLGATLAKKNRIKVFKTPIIAGKYKGKQLLIPANDNTRSSKTILRESLFNTISYDIVDTNFVEMFAGSGSIGFEALSRGANKTYFIEKDKTALQVLEDNANNIDSKNSVIISGDAFELFDNIYNNLSSQDKETIFYFDPPFSIREGMEDIYDKCINLISKVKDDFVKMVIIEHMSSINLPEKIGNLELFKTRKFGKSSLSYYRIKDNIE